MQKPFKFIDFRLVAFLCCMLLLAQCRSDSSPAPSRFQKVSYIDEEILPDHDALALIEIPAGDIHKYEMNKQTGQIEWERINGKGRIIHYLGYPGNYGMIPNTLLPLNDGGDGDPLDIIVLGPPLPRKSLISCKVIGVLNIVDNGERDDKLIALSKNAPFDGVSSIEDLDSKYYGILSILSTWFENYKGQRKIEILGLGSRTSALTILENARSAYKQELNHHE